MKTLTNFHKITFFMFALATSGLFIYGCKKSGGVDKRIANATSHICNQVTGVEAIYWDLMNGVPRTDIPGGLPTLSSIGGTYSNPSFPLLSFTYPPGYTPQTDATSGAVGVNLIRNDHRSIWRYTSILYSGTVTPLQVLNNEVAQLKAFFGSTGAVSTVCSQQGTLPRAPGITTSSASAYITFDGFSAAINVTNTTETGLGAVQINIVTTAAPTNEFSNEILHTYLPLDYQLLYTGSGEIDSDGDGFPDSQDDAPFDSTKH